MDLWVNKDTVYRLPKKLGEEAGRLLGVSVDGPYKPEHYRY